jgi:hypothetical protein
MTAWTSRKSSGVGNLSTELYPSYTLDATDLGPVEIRKLRETFLADALRAPQIADTHPESTPSVHGCPNTRVTTIGLQPISIIAAHTYGVAAPLREPIHCRRPCLTIVRF